MTIALGSLAILIGVFLPILSFLICLTYIFFIKKKSFFFLLLTVLWIGYFGSFYSPNFSDDMMRYIAYMNGITSNNLFDFIKQMYGPTPLSAYGLNGQTWPGSAIILYIIARFSNYRILSGITLAITYFVRLLPIKSFFADSSSDKVGRLILWLIVSIAWIPPLLPLSGFRWFLAISVLLLMAFIEVDRGFKVKYLIIYLLAGTLHPAVLMFFVIRVAALLISNGKYRYIGFGLILGIVGLMLHPPALLNTLSNQFYAYAKYSVTGLQLISNILSLILLLVILIIVYFFKKEINIHHGKELDSLNYLFVILIFNIVMFIFPVFDRFTQYTIPVAIIILGKLYIDKKNWKYWDFIMPIYIIILGFTIIFISPETSFPKLLDPLVNILFLPLHYNG